MMWRRKQNRLPAENYVGRNGYLVTVNTHARIPRFANSGVVSYCQQALLQAAGAEDMSVLAYVFMPDHLHLLLMGSEGSSLARFMKRLKQQTGFWFKNRTGEVLWQRSYHDHVVRGDMNLLDAARYVAANPVRAGLVPGWEAYPYTGGRLLDEARGDLKVAATPISSLQEGMAPS